MSVYSLGRTPLIEALEPLVERGELQITQEGNGALIIRELSDMEVLVNETTGNRRWATKPGLHDDMAVSAGMARWALHDLILRTATKTAPRIGGKIAPPPPSGGWT